MLSAMCGFDMSVEFPIQYFFPSLTKEYARCCQWIKLRVLDSDLLLGQDCRHKAWTSKSSKCENNVRQSLYFFSDDIASWQFRNC